MHVPADGPVRTTWILLAWVLQLTIVSSPCGHFLNATQYAGRHAIASLVFLGIGLGFGIAGFLWLGLVGAGVMRIGVDAGLAWVRIFLAERRLHWVREVRGAVVGCQISLAVAMVVGLMAPSWPWRLAVWAAGIASQAPTLLRSFSGSLRAPV